MKDDIILLYAAGITKIAAIKNSLYIVKVRAQMEVNTYINDLMAIHMACAKLFEHKKVSFESACEILSVETKKCLENIDECKKRYDLYVKDTIRQNSHIYKFVKEMLITEWHPTIPEPFKTLFNEKYHI